MKSLVMPNLLMICKSMEPNKYFALIWPLGKYRCSRLVDVYSRKILSWSIFITKVKKWCLAIFEDVICRHGKHEIVCSDQDSQYTSPAWTGYLEHAGIKVSMDGKGRATDNAWIERFWKNLKYDYIYLTPCDTGLEFFEGVQALIANYHEKRHQSLGMSPNKMYEKSTARIAA